LHLGTKGSKAKEVVSFFKQNYCETLILNGDIIDGWQLKKQGAWKKKHSAFFRQVLKAIDEYDTKVHYLRGNHDDFLDQILPFQIGKNFSIQRDMILKSGKKQFFVTHGDVFDSITSNMKWLAYLGDIGYTFLLTLNKFYNQYRNFRGLPYYSLSQVIKSKVKAAVSYVSDFEEKLTELAVAEKCDGVICGHIHQPAIRQIGELTYMNSGDWVESMTALVEDFKGNWKIIYHTDVLETENEETEEYEDSIQNFLNSNSLLKNMVG
jgi:UDP-2,3-diacylglucosamine pyrophosphatase LpxH